MSSAHQRLAALQAFAARDTDHNADFDRITALAADLCETPVAVIALIGDTGPVIGASLGIAEDGLRSFHQICAEAFGLCEDGVFVRQDCGRDAGLASDQPWEFFAAAELVTKDGLRLGMLCVADPMPRPKPAPRALDRLRLLADLVVDAIECRIARHEAEAARRLLALAEDLGRIGHWRYDLRRLDRNVSTEIGASIGPAFPGRDDAEIDTLISVGAPTWSDEVYRIYGVSRDCLPPDFAATMRFCHADDRAEFERQIRQAIEHKGSYVSARRILRADGSMLHVVSRGSVECDRQGRVTALFGVVQDVTEGEDAAGGQPELLADLSHEIRTPLNAIIGFADLLAFDTTLTGEQRQKALRIQAAGQGLLTLANDILQMSKLEAGQIRLEQHPFSPLALVRETAALIRLEADRKRLALVVDVPRIFDLLLIGDSDRIHRILLNLLSNAIKFTDRGEVCVGLDAEPVGSSMRIAISVRDSGRGIAAEQIPRLFRRYAQAEDSLWARAEGSGLGLAISKRLAEAMNGSITVQSRLDAGSCFVLSLTLPVAEAPAPVEAPEKSPEPGCVGALQGLRILVAEDVLINQRLVLMLLEPLGCVIDCVNNGAEALEAVQHEAYALVLMDIRMPVMDGIESARRIRALGGGFAHLPIVAMTASDCPEEIARCRAAGMSDHVTKPFGPGKLTAAVVAWTMGSAAGAAEGCGRSRLVLVGP